MPSLVPSNVGRAIVSDASCRIYLCWEYLVHSRSRCSLVCRISLSQGQVTGSSECGRNDLLNSPVYAWPILHWVRRPKSSRLSLSCRKWGVGLSEGGIWFDTAYLPVFGWFFHSFRHILRIELFDLLAAFARDTLYGA